MKRTGAQMLIEAFKQENVDTLFGYPGGYVIPIFDELYKEPSIDLILPRHEQGLIHMADGYARATGKIGVCLVTSGPGATNTITGLATANYDSVPLVCFTGQVPYNLIGNDAFQEADVVGLTRSVTKHNYIVENRKDLPRIIKEAFHIASTGRPGPVVVDLPIDFIKGIEDDEYPKKVKIDGYKPVINGHPLQIKKAAAKLMAAKRPLFLCGGGVNISNASKEFIELVEKTGVPVVTTLMGIGAIPKDHPLCIGSVGMHGVYPANMSLSSCDLIFSIGCRFSDRITGKLSEFAQHAEIIHIDIDTAAISRNVPVAVPIVGDAGSIIQDLIPLVEKCNHPGWMKDILEWEKTYSLKIVKGGKRVSPMEVIDSISEVFPDAVIATDVGQHQMWTSQFYNFKHSRSLLTSGGLGTMGYGLPAALGAQIGNRDKRVVCISGDGGIQMNIQELAVAAQKNLPVVIIIMNNNYLGMVRQWQQLFFDRHYSGTCLRQTDACPAKCNEFGDHCPPYIPDFVKLAQAYNIPGIRVSKQEDIIPALTKAREHKGGPILIEFRTEQEANVMPMIPAGGNITEMLLERGE
jgi:acetolactate synthase I/II/III large subunit